MLFNDSFDLIRDVIKCFIPADTLPLVDAAQLTMRVLPATGLPALALHGVFQTICGKHLVALRTATNARTLLRIFWTILMRIVGFLTNNNTIPDKHLIQATASAIVPASRSLPFTCDDIPAVASNILLFTGLNVILRTASKTCSGQGRS